MIDVGIGLGDAGVIALHAVIVVVSFLVLALVAGQTEHKLMAHMQGRLGPMYAGGFHGWAQLVADALKFAQKEAVLPTAVDVPVFQLAPAVAMIPYMIAMSVIPLSPSIVGADLDSGLFFVLAISAVGVLGTLMAGWASANKYALLGAMRSAGQLLAYELPIVLAAASVAMAAGTLSLSGIVKAWEPWWILAQLPGLVAFFIGGMAEIQRPPFDMPVADSEIVVGPYTEYSGMRFALFLFAEYAGMVVLSGMTAVLYFGGWQGPGPEALAPFWTLAKVGVLVMVIIWFRVSWPRMREDQLQRLAWGGLVPLALVQLGITSILTVLI